MINSLRIKALFMALLSFLISSSIGWALFHQVPTDGWTPLRSCLAGILSLVCFGVGSVYLFISSRLISEHFNLISSFKQAILTYTFLYIGRRRLDRMRSCTSDPRQAQEDLLQEIISHNKDTEYGLRFKLNDMTCLADFRSKHPLTEYNHYEPYVQRIARGEQNVMTANKVSRLLLTSGTTGKGKWIPRDMNELSLAAGTGLAISQESFPTLQPLQRGFRLYCNSEISKSECGITIAAANAIEKSGEIPMDGLSTPWDGFLIPSVNEAFYVHFLFALREKNLGWTTCVFVTTLVDGFKYLEEHWPHMVNDLANGTLNDDLDLPPSIRDNLKRALGLGDPARADEVRRECEKGQRGLMIRLWPNMVCVATIDNLGIRDKIMESFAEGLTVYSWIYSSSEVTFGYNCDPLQSGKEEYVLSIHDVLFEFIPREDVDKPNPRTLFVDEVKLGQAYELVISQANGLYRYRMGDVVEVSGFYNNAPKVKFLYRTGSVLNLFGEKVDQITVLDSLNKALSVCADVTALRHYCVAESTLLSGPLVSEHGGSKRTLAHYVFFLEMVDPSDEGRDPHDLGKLAQTIDDNIYSRHMFYRIFKDTNQIGTSRVHLVEPGSFNELKAFILANTTATESQFKMPKKLRTREMVEVMCENIQYN